MNQTTLTISRFGNRFIYQWRDSNRKPPPVARWQTDVDGTLLRDLCGLLIAEIQTAGTDPAAEGRLAKKGQRLFDVLIPATIEFGLLRSLLAALKNPLSLAIDDDEVPWELLHDGIAFWGRRYDLARRLETVRTRFGVAASIDPKEPSKRALLICDPDGSLPQALREADLIEGVLKNQEFDCTILKGSAATRKEVTQALASAAYSIIHYAGHLDTTGSEGHLSFLLADDAMPVRTLTPLIQGRPLVSLNGCISSWQLESATKAALEGNSRVAIGTICESMEVGGPEFAQSFYAFLLDGYPLGEAMRRARDHVAGEPLFGLAWACYVIYCDDPSFSVGAADLLEKELKAIGQSRKAFDVGALMVLEQAFVWGKRSGVHIAHLLLALQGGRDNTFRRWLRSRIKPGPGEDIEGVLERLIKKILDVSLDKPGTEQRFTSEVQDLLRASGEEARGQPIREAHLIQSLVRSGAGKAGAVLKRFGADLAELGSSTGDESEEFKAIGPILRDECAADGWSALENAAQLAAKGGCPELRTAHLLAAFVNAKDSQASQNLTHLGLSMDLEKLSLRIHNVKLRLRCATRPMRFSDRVPVSRGCGLILTMAQANASAGSVPITAQCLVEAFVQTGGGSTSSFLENVGLPTRILTTQLIDDDGGLRQSQFDEAALDVFERAVSFANRKGRRGLEQCSLLYGLLARPGGLLEKRIPAVAPAMTAELCAQYLNSYLSARDSSQTLGVNWTTFTANVRRILCLAEGYAVDRQPGEAIVQERDLLRAIQEQGGGECGKLILANGIPFGSL